MGACWGDRRRFDQDGSLPQIHPEFNSFSTMIVEEDDIVGPKHLDEVQLTNKQLKKRKHLMQELYSTEKTYIRGMQKIYNVYLDPLLEKKLITKETLNAFSSCSVLIQYHQKFMEMLQDELKFKFSENVFEKTSEIMKELIIYASFITSYEKMMTTVDKIRKESSTINQFFIRTSREDFPLDSFLMLPVQRITRYKMLFEQIKKYTPEDYYDYQWIKKTVEVVAEATDFTNECKRNYERGMELLEVASRLKGLRFPFWTPNRALISESKCKLNEDWEKMEEDNGSFSFIRLASVNKKAVTNDYILICNDVILLCDTFWKVKHVIFMDELESVSVEGTKLFLEKKVKKEKEITRTTSSSIFSKTLSEIEIVQSRIAIYAKQNKESACWKQQIDQAWASIKEGGDKHTLGHHDEMHKTVNKEVLDELMNEFEEAKVKFRLNDLLPLTAEDLLDCPDDSDCILSLEPSYELSHDPSCDESIFTSNKNEDNIPEAWEMDLPNEELEDSSEFSLSFAAEMSDDELEKEMFSPRLMSQKTSALSVNWKPSSEDLNKVMKRSASCPHVKRMPSPRGVKETISERETKNITATKVSTTMEERFNFNAFDKE